MKNTNINIEKIIRKIKTSDSELDLYTDLAPLYHNLYAAGYNFEKQADIVEEFEPETTSETTIIDLGCGNGNLLQHLYERKNKNKEYRLIGVDSSFDLLRKAIGTHQYTDSCEFMYLNDDIFGLSDCSRPKSLSYYVMDYREIQKVTSNTEIYSSDSSVDMYTSFGSLTSHLSKDELQSFLPVLYQTLAEEGRVIVDYHSAKGKNDNQHNNPSENKGKWTDYDGMVTQWETDIEGYIIQSTIITMNRGEKSEYAIAYEITNTETNTSYHCSQTLPIQFYTGNELEQMFLDAGFTSVRKLSEAPDRSGTIVAYK